MKRFALIAALALTACSKPSHVTFHYVLPDSLAPDSIARIVTTVTTDGATFAVTKPRTVADGIVLSESTDTPPAVLVTFNTASGYTFRKTFEFTLLAPSGKTVSVVTRAYDSSNTIGHSVATTATFSSSGTTTVTLIDDRCGSEPCTDGKTCCAGTCIDSTTDDKNCGACGTTCTGVTDKCVASACTCDGASACPAGDTCANGCIDTRTDLNNCGAIGTKCGLGETCTNSKCGCGTGASCGSGSLCCDGACVAGNGCPCGSAGTCTATAPICCSGDTCINTQNDNTNCGACGKACDSGEDCVSGDCMCGDSAACNAGDTCCDAGCKTLMTDVMNCGVCGKACAAGEVCTNGNCECGTSNADCIGNQICCATGSAATDGGVAPASCVDPTAKANCGACGNTCGDNESCTAAGCQCMGTTDICTTGQTCCPSSGCTDLTRDPANCNTCGHTCAAGQTCSGGLCTGSSSNVCTPQCANGLSCNGGNCQCQGTDGNFKMCSGSTPACCNNACADFSSPATCGSCGKSCSGTTPFCAGGSCVQCGKDADCSASQLCCGGACVARSNSQCVTCGVQCGSGTCCTIPGNGGSYACKSTFINLACMN